MVVPFSQRDLEDMSSLAIDEYCLAVPLFKTMDGQPFASSLFLDFSDILTLTVLNIVRVSWVLDVDCEINLPNVFKTPRIDPSYRGRIYCASGAQSPCTCMAHLAV